VKDNPYLAEARAANFGRIVYTAEQVRAALEDALSPELNFDPKAVELKELVALVLRQKVSPLCKAEKIARIVALWRQES
jgi:hypothetical protein